MSQRDIQREVTFVAIREEVDALGRYLRELNLCAIERVPHFMRLVQREGLPIATKYRRYLSAPPPLDVYNEHLLTYKLDGHVGLDEYLARSYPDLVMVHAVGSAYRECQVSIGPRP